MRHATTVVKLAIRQQTTAHLAKDLAIAASIVPLTLVPAIINITMMEQIVFALIVILYVKLVWVPQQLIVSHATVGKIGIFNLPPQNAYVKKATINIIEPATNAIIHAKIALMIPSTIA